MKRNTWILSLICSLLTVFGCIYPIYSQVFAAGQNLPLATFWYGLLALIGITNFVLLIVFRQKLHLFSISIPAGKEKPFYIVEAACFVGAQAIGGIIFFLCTSLIDQQTLAYNLFSSTMQFSCLDIQMVLFFVLAMVFELLIVFKESKPKRPLFFFNEFVIFMALAFFLPVNGTTLLNLAFGNLISPEARPILQIVPSYFFQGVGLILYFIWKGKRLLQRDRSSQNQK